MLFRMKKNIIYQQIIASEVAVGTHFSHLGDRILMFRDREVNGIENRDMQRNVFHVPGRRFIINRSPTVTQFLEMEGNHTHH